MWSEYTGEDSGEAMETNVAEALAPEYLDVYVSSVRDTDPFGFSVQILDTDSKLAAQVTEFVTLPLISRCYVTGEVDERLFAASSVRGCKCSIWLQSEDW